MDGPVRNGRGARGVTAGFHPPQAFGTSDARHAANGDIRPIAAGPLGGYSGRLQDHSNRTALLSPPVADGRAERRISVVGSSGSGKSTTARAIGSALDLPVIELDAINWQPGWRDLNTHDPAEFVRRVQAAVAAPAWVVDGNYGRVKPHVLRRATDVIWLDLPFGLIMRRVFRRSIVRSLARREVWPGTGNVEYWRNWLNGDHPFWWSLNHFTQRRRRYETAFADPRLGHLAIHRVRTPAEVRTLVECLVRGDGVATGLDP
jgi:adenylate kinase family enzyme